MPYLSPPTLTRAEQAALLRVSGVQPRDQVIFSLALGTGLRLSEIVGLNVGGAFTADGKPRSRIRLRKEIAKGGRAGDVFLPDALGPKLVRSWRYKVRSGESLSPTAPLFANQSGHRSPNAASKWHSRPGSSARGSTGSTGFTHCATARSRMSTVRRATSSWPKDLQGMPAPSPPPSTRMYQMKSSSTASEP